MNTEAKAFQRFINFQLLGSEDIPEDPKAAFQCGKYKSNKNQRAWIEEYFMKVNLPILVTIKLPEWRDRHVTTKNYYASLEQYRNLIRETEQEFTNSKNHWNDKPLPFIGSFQKTKSETWMFYILVKTDVLPKSLIYKLCLSIQTIIDKFGFDEEVIDIRPVTKQEGISLFVIKDQKYNEDLTYDEGNTIHTLETLFKVKENPKQLSKHLQYLEKTWSNTVKSGLGEFLKFNVSDDI